mgnify:CR=1 FL=1
MNRNTETFKIAYEHINKKDLRIKPYMFDVTLEDNEWLEKHIKLEEWDEEQIEFIWQLKAARILFLNHDINDIEVIKKDFGGHWIDKDYSI